MHAEQIERIKCWRKLAADIGMGEKDENIHKN